MNSIELLGSGTWVVRIPLMPDLRCQGCPLFGQVINALCTLDKRFDVASLLQIVGRVLSASLFAGFFLAVLTYRILSRSGVVQQCKRTFDSIDTFFRRKRKADMAEFGAEEELESHEMLTSNISLECYRKHSLKSLKIWRIVPWRPSKGFCICNLIFRRARRRWGAGRCD